MSTKNPHNKPEICLVVTSLLIVKFFLIPHITALSERYVVTLVVNVDDPVLLESMVLPAKIVSMPIERKLFPWRDMVVLCRLIMLFRRSQFKLVHSISPKAGLLGMLAAWLSGIPVRVHTFQGEVWITRRGLWRAILKMADRVVARLATRVTVVSRSEREFLISNNIISAENSIVLAHGSICGVDPLRFRPDNEARRSIRKDLGIHEDAVVILFLGRINRDKGILDLTRAFNALAWTAPQAVLLIVGPDEEDLCKCIQQQSSDHIDRIKLVGFTQMPECYMAAADVLCLPSRREGFGLVIIEAASVGIPSICSRIYGITDAVEDKKTGLLFPVGDVLSLEQCLHQLVKSSSVRQVMGAAARERTVALFSTDLLVNAMLQFYVTLIPVVADENGVRT